MRLLPMLRGLAADGLLRGLLLTVRRYCAIDGVLRILFIFVWIWKCVFGTFFQLVVVAVVGKF